MSDAVRMTVRELLAELMRIPGLAGHEERVRRRHRGAPRRAWASSTAPTGSATS